MCLAIPMRVNEIHGDQDDPLSFPIAVVDENGLRKEVRLDVVDRWPSIGDYIIVHAGFAIHTLDPSLRIFSLILYFSLVSKIFSSLYNDICCTRNPAIRLKYDIENRYCLV